MKELVRKAFRKFGYDFVKINQPTSGQFPPDFSQDDVSTYLKVRPYTLTTPERVYSLIKAVEYVTANNIPGDIVECGVYKGGSMMAIAYTLLKLNQKNRDLYLFDTFKGMTEPGANDGELNHKIWSSYQTSTHNEWTFASKQDVENNMLLTSYPKDKLHFVEGDVRDTIPREAPKQISILRLDTDFYDSTKHELKHLFPLLSPRGVLIIDDYGSFEGSRKATNEYLNESQTTLMLSRIDADARLAIKY